MTTAPACTVCAGNDLRVFLDLGQQPPSNRFISPANGNVTDERYSLSLGRCDSCGTIQLVERIPVEAIRPRYDWLSYNEPEGHLDDVASHLAALSGIKSDSRIVGITYKDASTLARLERMGFTGTILLPENDLDAPERPFGLETIQAILSEESAVARLAAKYGNADIVLFRHIVEHSTSAARILRSMLGLLAPNGYLVFEVPDPEKMLRSGNHAFIWEEHLSYFTEGALQRLAAEVKAEMVWLGRYPYAYEDSLVAVLRFTGASTSRAGKTDETSKGDLEHFAAAFEPSRLRWRKALEAHRAAGRKVAIFGAGHLSAKFVNFLGVADLIDCVIDDHPKKTGMLMPGSRLPIVPSSELASRKIAVCISTLSPESEVKVRAKLASFFEGGGVFEPAFIAA